MPRWYDEMPIFGLAFAAYVILLIIVFSCSKTQKPFVWSKSLFE